MQFSIQNSILAVFSESTAYSEQMLHIYTLSHTTPTVHTELLFPENCRKKMKGDIYLAKIKAHCLKEFSFSCVHLFQQNAYIHVYANLTDQIVWVSD